ncbi:MAG: hypothetical protein AAF515_06675 [Pseudomonadota bacterium]
MTTDVPRFAWLSALSMFALFLLLLFGAAEGRSFLQVQLGPLPLSLWVVLGLHIGPVVLGALYLRRDR